MNAQDYIRRCLHLAHKGEKYVRSNPMVGCVIVRKDEIVAEGFHQSFGGPHAEVNAFKSLNPEIPTQDCTVYVSLEPCSHYGKTPPCADLLIEKRPNKVVIGTLDPNDKVSGRGIKKLIGAGIDVQVGIEEELCKQLNKKFWKAQNTSFPYITLKWAETADNFMGRSVGDDRSPRISSKEADQFVHHLRATHQGILIGAGTANRDRPQLNVRLVDGLDPTRIILSPNNSVQRDLSLFDSGQNLIYTLDKNASSHNSKYVEYVTLESWNLTTVLEDLHNRGVHSILVEGGPTILNSFIKNNLWDEAVIIKSNRTWEEGIKAPWLGIPSIKEESLGSDTIKYFKPPNKPEWL